MISQEKVLDQLNSGEISFSEASRILGISKKEVKEIFENYDGLPSIERIKELREEEKKTITYIKEIRRQYVPKNIHKPKKLDSPFRINFQNVIKVPCSNLFIDFTLPPVPVAVTINDIETRFENSYMTYQSEEYKIWN
jgi:hypothetical protein